MRFREAFGERRPFIQAPGHLIRGDELDDGISILLMTLLFTWDSTVLAGNEPVAFFCSHDEWNSFFVRSAFDPAALLDEFGNVLYRGGWGRGEEFPVRARTHASHSRTPWRSGPTRVPRIHRISLAGDIFASFTCFCGVWRCYGLTSNSPSVG
jgi:hypothetical protein